MEIEGSFSNMPTAKEFILTMDDRPVTLGKICRALSERNVNIIAAQSFPVAGKSTTRFVFDDPTKARSVLDNERATYTERMLPRYPLHTDQENWRVSHKNLAKRASTLTTSIVEPTQTRTHHSLFLVWRKSAKPRRCWNRRLPLLAGVKPTSET